MIYEKKFFSNNYIIINLKRVTVRKGCHFYFSNIKMNKIFFGVILIAYWDYYGRKWQVGLRKGLAKKLWP